MPGVRPWLGVVLALLSALAFAFNLALAGLVYQDGGNTHALNLVRPTCFALVLLLYLRATGGPLMLPRSRRFASIGLGVLLCIDMYALLGAIAFIPVGLAVLIMYTYPVMVAVLAWLDGSERLGVGQVVAMLVAFGGLVLALQVPDGALDPRGVGLAVITAVSFALLVYLSGRTMQGQDRRTVMLHTMLTSSVIVAVASTLFATPAWPLTAFGWWALAGSTLFFIVATFLLFTAIGLIGPLRTAIVDNTSPIWAMLFAFMLLGERMSALQSAGAAVVIGAVVYVQWAEGRVPRPLPHP